MATRSLIVTKQSGQFLANYVHYDGDLDCNGSLLKKHYTDLQSVKNIVIAPEWKYLERTVSDCVPLSKKQSLKIFNKKSDLINYFKLESDCEYMYLYEGSKWKYIDLEMSRFKSY